MAKRKKMNEADAFYISQNTQMSAAEISDAISLEESVVEEKLNECKTTQKTWAQKAHTVKDGVYQSIGADPTEEDVAQAKAARLKKSYVYRKP